MALSKSKVVFSLSLLLNIVFIVGLGVGIYFLSTNTNLLNPDTGFLAQQEDPVYEIPEQAEAEPGPAKPGFHTVNLGVPEDFRNGAFGTTRRLTLPEGLGISVYYAGLSNPRGMTVDPDGNLFVAERKAHRIIMLKDTNGDLAVDDRITVTTNIFEPHSVFYHNGDLYIGAANEVLVLTDVKNDGTFAERKVLVSSLPGFGHSTKTVIIGPDNMLYMAMGSSCNVCEENDARRAAITRYKLDGTRPETFASGLRNTVGLTFRLNNSLQYELWGVDNGRDLIGDNIPPEEVNLIQQGKHYGWPYCHGDGTASPEHPGRSGFCQDETEIPRHSMQAHSAPLSIEVVPRNNGLFPSLRNQFVIGFHGSWNRTTPTGYKVVSVDPNAAKSGEVDLVTGWLVGNQAWGRPVDVKFSPKGQLFISDDSAGAIYIVKK